MTPNTIFQYLITLKSGTYVYVSRAKDNDKYLELTASLYASKPDYQTYLSLTKDQQKQVYDAVVLEAARSGVAYTVNSSGGIFVTLGKSVLITPGLNDNQFANYLNEIDSAEAACRQELRLALERLKAIPD